MRENRGALPWVVGLLLLVALAVPLLGASWSGTGGCFVLDNTSPVTYFDGRSHELTILFEEDTSATAQGAAEVTLSLCTFESNLNSCEDYLWDSDSDGVPDTAILTGAAGTQRGLSNIKVAGWILPTFTTAPGGGETPHLEICRVKTWK